MSRWRQVVRRELRRYQTETGQEVLERQEFLGQCRSIFQRDFPENRTPGQKFSQVMQQLKRRGEVEFIDNDGTYRILSLDFDPAGEAANSEESTYHASEYETTVGARSMPAAFRDAILNRYAHACPVSGVDHDCLLDVAHILPWGEYPDHRTNPGNVVVLSKTHHAAFDAGMFTLDGDFRLHVNPELDTNCDLLRRTLVDRDGSKTELPDDAPLTPSFLDQHNQQLDWW